MYKMDKEKKELYLKIALLIVLIAGGLYWAKGFFAEPNGAAVSNSEQELRVATLELPGMFCAACAWSAGKTIKGIPGVVDANVDIKVKKGTVLYYPGVVSKEQLVEPGLIKAYDGKIINDKKYYKE